MNWVTAWSYLPIEYNTSLGIVEDITQRTILDNNVSGERVKVKFSNRYSQEALILEKVVLGQRKPGETAVEHVISVTKDGRERIELKPDEEFYSDAISWNVKAGNELVLSIYIKAKTNIQSSASNWSARCFRTRYGLHGDHTLEDTFSEVHSREVFPYVEGDVNKADVIVGVTGIYVETNDEVKNITMFGDSITHMSYYSDALTKKMYQAYPGQVTIVNRGIGGNRILNDATVLEEHPSRGKVFGDAAIKRYKTDLFSENIPNVVLLLEGVNDIMHPYQFDHRDEIVTAKQLQQGMSEMIETIHSYGAKAYLGTIMPFLHGEMDWFEEAEAIRLEYNAWVREQTLSDGILDFDQAIQSNENPSCMSEELHIGDGLHPNVLGGEMMAALVPIEKIMEEK